MKIFDWMHRKFHPGGVKYSQVSQRKDVFGGDDEEKRVVSIEGVLEKEALLLHDVLNGILTIGTLGHQESFLSHSYSTQEDELPQEGEGLNNVSVVVEEKEEGNEVAPALTVPGELPSPVVVAVEPFKFKLPVIEAKGMMKAEIMVAQYLEETEKIQESPLLKEDKEKRERGRTTLADLFAAEAFNNGANDLTINNNANKLGDGARVKRHASSERKKAQKYNKEEKWIPATSTKPGTTTNRKLHKLVTKILKKKIHPEMAALPKAAPETKSKERNKEASYSDGRISTELVRV